MTPPLPKIPLTASLPHADKLYLSVGCRGCHRSVEMGIRRAVRLAAGISTDEWLARLRCTECGHRGAMVQVHPDTRPHDVFLRDGPHPVTQET